MPLCFKGLFIVSPLTVEVTVPRFLGLLLWGQVIIAPSFEFWVKMNFLF